MGTPGAPCDCPLPTSPHTWRPSALRPGRGRSRDRTPWAPWNSQPAPRTQAPRPRSNCSLHRPVPLGGERQVPPGTQPRAGQPSLEAPAPRSRRPAAVSVRAGPLRGSPGSRGSDSVAWGQAACAAGVSGAATQPSQPRLRGTVAALRAPRRAPLPRHGPYRSGKFWKMGQGSGRGSPGSCSPRPEEAGRIFLFQRKQRPPERHARLSVRNTCPHRRPPRPVTVSSGLSPRS